jgi:cullin 1
MVSPAPSNAFTNMPPRTADLDETWDFLNEGVDHIMTRLEQGLSFAGYTSLYTTVYNYCTSTKMHGKLGSTSDRSEYYIWVAHTSYSPILPGGANLVGSDLYKKLYAYFVAHFKSMTEVGVLCQLL